MDFWKDAMDRQTEQAERQIDKIAAFGTFRLSAVAGTQLCCALDNTKQTMKGEKCNLKVNILILNDYNFYEIS